jgi:hypothetical protein
MNREAMRIGRTALALYRITAFAPQSILTSLKQNVSIVLKPLPLDGMLATRCIGSQANKPIEST